MINKSKMVAGFFLITAGFTSQAFAGPENYPGSECVHRAGGAVHYDFDGAVSNTSSTQPSWVLCHVPHTDFDGFLNPGEVDSGFVDTVDLNPSADVRCRFRSRSISNNGNMVRYYGAMGNTSGYGTQRRTINLNGVGENSRSAYVLACEIPPRTSNGMSRVVTYRVNQ